ncbi:MAG: hypothetical protein MI919_22225 [Holophagales bacterium]|nr:hypothetical protein [Holophagales bacterium]
MPRQTTILALLVLLMVSSLYAADPADESGDSAVKPETEVSAADLAAVLGDNGVIPILSAPPFEGGFTSAERAAPVQGFGGCYTSCYPQLDGLCAPGQVAEATVTGPPQACGLADFRCVDRCSGPVLRCNFFALC